MPYAGNLCDHFRPFLTRWDDILYLMRDPVRLSSLPFDADKLAEVCRQNDVAKLSVFGSVARGEAGEKSDIDLLVEFSKPKSLLSLVAVERRMSAALGKKVDLLTEAALSPYLRDQIKRDLYLVYEA